MYIRGKGRKERSNCTERDIEVGMKDTKIPLCLLDYV